MRHSFLAKEAPWTGDAYAFRLRSVQDVIRVHLGISNVYMHVGWVHVDREPYWNKLAENALQVYYDLLGMVWCRWKLSCPNFLSLACYFWTPLKGSSQQRKHYYCCTVIGVLLSVAKDLDFVLWFIQSLVEIYAFHLLSNKSDSPGVE